MAPPHADLKKLGNMFDERIAAVVKDYGIKPGDEYGRDMWDAMTVASVEVTEEPASGPGAKPRKSCKLVHELVVKPAWSNPVGVLHGAATAYIIDTCTSLAIMAISDADFWPGLGGLSQNLNILYHAPAPIGAKIRITSTTLNVGKAIANIRCEMHDCATGKLLASGTHTKAAAKPKRAAKL